MREFTHLKRGGGGVEKILYLTVPRQEMCFAFGAKESIER